MEKQFYVYILTDSKHHTLYTGVTSNLIERIYQHKAKLFPGFTSRYNTTMLVYYEEMADALTAIAREKQIKGGSRQDKIKLINKVNPNWSDLFEQLG
jgi:putative endonuclease